MVVPTRFGSGVEMAGEAHARDAINKTTTAQKIGLNLNMFASFRSTHVIIIPKTNTVPSFVIDVQLLNLFLIFRERKGCAKIKAVLLQDCLSDLV